MTTDITELTSVQKNANIHRLSRLIAYAPNDELRQMAVEVEQYTDQLIEALEKAQQHIARQEQIILNQDESLSIRRGELEAAQQERENWHTSFDNERFRADKLKAHIDEMTEEQTASINELSRIIQKEVKAKREAEKRIAELESRTVTAEKLQESAYRAGLTAGWNLGLDNNNDGFNKCLAAHAAGIKWEAE